MTMPVQKVPSSSVWLRVWQGLTQPERLFESMRNQWSWAPAYWLSAAGLLASALALLPITQAVVRRSLEQTQLPTSAIEVALLSQTIGALLTPFVQPLYKAFLYAFVMMLVGGALSVRVRFSKLFSIVIWSALPASTFGPLITAALLRMTPIESHQQISLSGSLFLPVHLYGTFVHAFLLSLDVFAVWTLCLLGVGFNTVHRVSTFKTAIVVSAVYLITLIINIYAVQVSTTT